MILVDDVGGILPSINHSPWDGVTLADFVMPFFLFIVGVSLAFAYKVTSFFVYSMLESHSSIHTSLLTHYMFVYRTCHVGLSQQEKL
jgi:predicted acyltransferase